MVGEAMIDTTNIYHSDTLLVMTGTRHFDRMAKALGGVYFAYTHDRSVIVVKDVEQRFELGRGCTVRQALQAAWDGIMGKVA